MRGEHPWRLLGPEPTLEVIVTYYENRSIGMQVNNYEGRPVHPDTTINLLSGVLRGLKQAREASQEELGGVEAVALNLLCEEDSPGDEGRVESLTRR